MSDDPLRTMFDVRHRRTETCPRCDGSGEELMEVAQAGDQAIYEDGPCGLCDGRGWVTEYEAKEG